MAINNTNGYILAKLIEYCRGTDRYMKQKIHSQTTNLDYESIKSVSQIKFV